MLKLGDLESKPQTSSENKPRSSSRKAIAVVPLLTIPFVVIACVGALLGCEPARLPPDDADLPECAIDADCDDELYCNGAESCVNGQCESGDRPCDPETTCATCDEDGDVCVVPACTVDADCDDGLFCNGFEQCLNCVCTEGEAPCPNTEDCIVCMEDLDACASGCGSDEECNDGVFCNGVESCFECLCFSGEPPCADCSEDQGCP